MQPNHNRFVVCAALKYGDLIVAGPRHFDHIMQPFLKDARERTGIDTPDQGFIDQYGKYMSRREALEIATAEGQVGVRRPKGMPADRLFSEDLY